MSHSVFSLISIKFYWTQNFQETFCTPLNFSSAKLVFIPIFLFFRVLFPFTLFLSLKFSLTRIFDEDRCLETFAHHSDDEINFKEWFNNYLKKLIKVYCSWKSQEISNICTSEKCWRNIVISINPVKD